MKGGHMSPIQAEQWLGLRPSSQGRALVRRAFEREKELGKKFLIRRGGQGKGIRYVFTREMIRRYMQDLWQARFDRLATRAATTVKEIQAHIDDRIDARIEKHPVVRTLQRRQDDTIELVERLTSTVAKVARVTESHK
jgi:hypothetical protein